MVTATGTTITAAASSTTTATSATLKIPIKQGAVNGPLLAVQAIDLDSGRNGAITYRITAGNEAELFRIDKNSGELFINRPLNLLSATSRSSSLMATLHQNYMLNVSASDGGGLRSAHDAIITICIVDPTQMMPIFERLRYSFHVKEDVSRGTVIGTVTAQWNKPNTNVGATGNLHPIILIEWLHLFKNIFFYQNT